jgi:hypothetical protein
MDNKHETQLLGNESASEHVPTGAHLFAPWLTVQEAVAYCVSKGLPRTPKTVRKWAQRSVETVPGTGDVIVQRQDTENGFRWLISRESLDVKIEQEKEFGERADEQIEGSHPSEPVPTGAYLFEQVASGANMSAPVLATNKAAEPVRTDEYAKEGLRGNGVENVEIVELLKRQLDRAERQLDVKDRQIEALLERDRETNVLIQGLQTSLTHVASALPSGGREPRNDS